MREKILKLFEVTHAVESFRDLTNMIVGGMITELAKDDPDFAAKIVNVLNLAIAENMDEVTEKFIRLYEETYNESDIDAMLAWHNSPVGRKVEAMTLPLREGGAAIGLSISPKINARLEQFLANYKD